MNRRDFIKKVASLAFLPSIAKANPIVSSLAAHHTGILPMADDGLPLPYVSKGLVAMWDGICNVSWETHDAESQVWVDLIGGNELLVNDNANVVWTGSGLLSRSAIAGNYAIQNNLVPDALCMQVFMTSKGTLDLRNYRIVNLQSQSNGRYCLGMGNDIIADGGGNASCRTYSLSKNDQEQLIQDGLLVTMNYRSSNPKYADELFLNTSLIQSSGTAWGGWISAYGIGGTGVWQAVAGVVFNSIRLYSRNLTEAEIAYNNEIDRERFVS